MYCGLMANGNPHQRIGKVQSFWLGSIMRGIHVHAYKIKILCLNNSPVKDTVVVNDR